MTVWNHGTRTIFINLGVIADPNGGPGRGETTFSIAPGQGIDLAICCLLPEKPPQVPKDSITFTTQGVK